MSAWNSAPHGLLIIATVAAAAQARAQAGRATFARLERAEVEALAERAVRERLRPLLAEALTGGGALPLDGTPVEMVEGPVTFTLRLNDSAGLADLYFAPPALLAALPGGARVAGRRAEVIGALPPGERFPTLASSLARLGADRDTRRGLGAVLTQSGAPGALNGPEISPWPRHPPPRGHGARPDRRAARGAGQG
ncbi:MAG: hypothetical protein R3D56_04305 [Paracoccaceae bacterium]